VKLIVGLGNPGAQYERTRHNAGFLVVDRLADRHAKGAVPRSRFNAVTLEVDITTGAFGGSVREKCLLMKPTTYMNRSGLAVADAVRFYKLNPVADILVIVDDVYLPCGSIRLRESGSDGGHNGLADIQRLLGTDKYPRCRIGVDPPGIIPQADYVLGKFTEEQWPQAVKSFDLAADAAETFIKQGIAAAMNKHNGKATEHQSRQRRKDETRPVPGSESTKPETSTTKTDPKTSEGQPS
jgi:PTH1 family peptidyl-tRNA hydrolase